MTLDARSRSLARKMTGKYGKAITLRKTESTFDPGTGETVETTTDYPIQTAPPEPYELRYIDGSLVQTGDVRLFVPAISLPEQPDTSWTAQMNGATWQIVAVRPVPSGEDFAAYELQARK